MTPEWGGACKALGRLRGAPRVTVLPGLVAQRVSFAAPLPLRRRRRGRTNGGGGGSCSRGGGGCDRVRVRGVGGPYASAARSHVARAGVHVGLGGPGLAGRRLPAASALAAGELAGHPGGLARLREHRHRPLLPARPWRAEWRDTRRILPLLNVGELKQRDFENTSGVMTVVTKPGSCCSQLLQEHRVCRCLLPACLPACCPLQSLALSVLRKLQP